LSVEAYGTQIVREYNKRIKQDFVFPYDRRPVYHYDQIIMIEGPNYSLDLFPDNYPLYYRESYFDHHRYENTWVENDSHEELSSKDDISDEPDVDVIVNIHGDIRITDATTFEYFLDRYSKFREQFIIAMNLDTKQFETHLVRYYLKVVN